MNAADQITSLLSVQAIASVGTLLKKSFPDATINFSPWREDPYTQFWCEEDSVDLALDFPGWSPKLQCRSLLIQLRVVNNSSGELPRLLGVTIRGVAFDGERWRLATIGDWEPTGSHLPQEFVKIHLRDFCLDLFKLFP